MYPIWPHNSPTGFLQPGSMLRRSRFWEYSRLVRQTYRGNLVRYWPLWDTSGTVAADLSNNRGNGVYSGVTFKQDGMGDGHQCPLFASSFVNCYSAAFNTAFPRAAGTIAVWAKVLNAGVWTDGANHYLGAFQFANGGKIWLLKATSNNTFRCIYTGPGSPDVLSLKSVTTTTNWFHFACTWNFAEDDFILYYQGVVHDTKADLGTQLSGSMLTTASVFGASSTAAGSSWSGYLMHPAIWNVALPAQTIKRLYRG